MRYCDSRRTYPADTLRHFILRVPLETAQAYPHHTCTMPQASTTLAQLTSLANTLRQTAQPYQMRKSSRSSSS